MTPLSEHKCHVFNCSVCGERGAKRGEHQCYIQPVEHKEDDFDDRTRPMKLAFFDFETRCLEEFHVVNKAVVLLVCEECQDHIEEWRTRGCTGTCGRKRLWVFETIEEFMDWLLGPLHSTWAEYTFLAHNLKGYDSYPILNEAIRRNIRPSACVYQGTKLLTMTIADIVFKDSLCFILTSLRQFPSTFGTPGGKKGFFPHFFNRKGLWVRRDDVGEREERAKRVDVLVMMRGCLKYRELYVTLFGVDPFAEAVTLASTCLRVFNKNHLEAQTIGVVPPMGYRPRDVYSFQALEWLHSLNLPSMLSALSPQGEVTLLGDKVDGYDETTKTVYQYHGCEVCFKNRFTTNPYLGQTMLELREQKNGVQSRGNVESRLGRGTRTTWHVSSIGDPSRAFGPSSGVDGRSDECHSTVCVHDSSSRDVQSCRSVFARDGGPLVPSSLYRCGFVVSYCDETKKISFGSSYPMDHPVASNSVRMPREDYVGRMVWSVESRRGPTSRIVFSRVTFHHSPSFDVWIVSRMQEEEEEKEEKEETSSCPHTVEERRLLDGVWTTFELKKALEKGYHLHTVHEVWHYPRTSTTLFKNYIDANLKLKMEASGWPSRCQTEQEKQQFLQDVLEREGVHLDASQMEHNPGMRSIAKLNLNSLWGKYAQNQLRSKTQYVTEPEEYYRLIYSDTHEVSQIVLLDGGEMAQVTYKELKESVQPLPYGNVILAACVTSWARLLLYEMLERLQTRVLYHNTDSIIYKTEQADDEQVPTGSSLGQWEDECKDPERDWLTEFVSIGPKSYAYRTHQGKVMVKCKGITLDQQASSQIHMQSMKHMVMDESRQEMVQYRRRIARDPVLKRLQTVSLDKCVQLVYKTYPFGYWHEQSQCTLAQVFETFRQRWDHGPSQQPIHHRVLWRVGRRSKVLSLPSTKEIFFPTKRYPKPHYPKMDTEKGFPSLEKKQPSFVSSRGETMVEKPRHVSSACAGTSPLPAAAVWSRVRVGRPVANGFIGYATRRRETGEQRNGMDFVCHRCLVSKMLGRPLEKQIGPENSDHSIPRVIYVDEGKEFYNKEVKQLLNKYPIPPQLQSGHSTKKAAIVERLQRTIKNHLWKYFYEKGSYRWVDAYNARPHRAIGRPPQDVTKANEEEVFKTLYQNVVQYKEAFDRAPKEIQERVHDFQVGDVVRISIAAQLFDKKYLPRWSEELFRIRARDRGPPVFYRLEQLDGNERVEGTFYATELQRVDPKHLPRFRIEAILDRRIEPVNKRKKQVLVKMDRLREARRPFFLWATSDKDPSYARTQDNTSDDFTVELDNWTLKGTWSVQVVDAIMSEVDENQTRGDVMVYCDFIESAIVGHGMFPLLDRVGYTGKKWIRNQSKRKVDKNRLETLGFKLADAEGKKPVWLDTNQVTLLCLQFKPEKESFEDMDYTFLSNLSTSTYPKNKASHFTAVLPGAKTLKDLDRWAMGMTKISLPPVTTAQKVSEWEVHLIPSFALPPTAITSAKIGNVSSLDELMKDYNTKMKSIINSWFPNNPNGGGLSCPIEQSRMTFTVIGKQEKTVDFGGRITIFELNRKLAEESKNTIFIRASFATKTAFLFLLYGTTINYIKSPLLKRLGFLQEDMASPTLRSRNLTTYFASTSAFNKEDLHLYSFQLVGSSMFKDEPMPSYSAPNEPYTISTGFFQNFKRQGVEHLTLLLPGGMYDLLGMEKSGVSSTAIKGETYLETLVKGSYDFPHDTSSAVFTTNNWHGLLNCFMVNQTIQTVPKPNPLTKKLEIVSSSNLKTVNTVAHVLCDAVDYQKVGAKSLQLLATFNMSAAAVGNQSQPKQYLRDPHLIMYKPLKTSVLHHLNFQIQDDRGREIQFDKGGVPETGSQDGGRHIPVYKPEGGVGTQGGSGSSYIHSQPLDTKRGRNFMGSYGGLRQTGSGGNSHIPVYRPEKNQSGGGFFRNQGMRLIKTAQEAGNKVMKEAAARGAEAANNVLQSALDGKDIRQAAEEGVKRSKKAKKQLMNTLFD
ncbi:putative uncharacterized transposon-derived protein F54H12.3 [Exaiptasia diaphana]|nr:putative uncharacterized transposon-derived protein F54H12.3 [Exaiptasia diaphana]